MARLDSNMQLENDKTCFRFQRPLPNSSSFQDDETEIKPEASFSTRNWLARLFQLKDKAKIV